MTDEETIELVAKWLYRIFCLMRPVPEWEGRTEGYKQGWRKEARELLALREDCKWCDEDPNVALSREEALACILALDKTKPYGWRNKALKKLELAMGMKVRK